MAQFVKQDGEKDHEGPDDDADYTETGVQNKRRQQQKREVNLDRV